MITILLNLYKQLLAFAVKLIDSNNPLQAHNLINILWGVGSFFFYWIDHFVKDRPFTQDDYWFIIGMCGLISTVAAFNNRTTKSTGTPSGAPNQSIEKKEDNCSIGDG